MSFMKGKRSALAHLRTDDIGSRGPLPQKRKAIVDYVCCRVVTGKWKSGCRLPEREWFMSHFEVTKPTVQAAFDVLCKDGFVRSIRGKGTFVEDRMPFDGRYLLVLGSEKGQQDDNLFTRALTECAAEVARRRGVRIDCRYALERWQDPRIWAKIVADVSAQRYAGVFIQRPGGGEEMDRLIALSRVPIVGFGISDWKIKPGTMFASVRQDRKNGVWTAVYDHFRTCADAGCEKVVVLGGRGGPFDDERALIRIAKAYGLELCPEFIHMFDINTLKGAGIERLFELLCVAVEPDGRVGVVIGDDNLLSPFVAVILRRYGRSAVRRFFITSHANFNCMPDVPFPVVFIGLDVGFLLEDFIRYSNEKRKGLRRVRPPSVRVARLSK